MLNVSQMKPLKIYNVPIIMYDNKAKNTMIGNNILIMPSTEDETNSMLKYIYDSGELKANVYKSYYLQKVYKYKVFNHVTNKNMLNIQDIYKNIKTTHGKNIKRTYKDIANYGNTNKIIDCREYISDLMTYIAKFNNNTALNVFEKYMNLILSQYVQNDKTNYIIINTSAIDISNLSNFQNIDSVLKLIYLMIIKRPSNLNIFKNTILLLTNNKLKIKIDFNSLDGDNLKYLKSNLKNIFVKMDKGNTIVNYDVEDVKNIVYNKIDAKITSTLQPEQKAFTGTDNAVDTNNTKVNAGATTTDTTLIKDNINKIVEPGDTIEDAESKINDNPEIKVSVENIITSNNGTSYKSSKRDEELSKNQMNVKLQGKTLEDIFKDAENATIPPKVINITTLNPDMKVLKSINQNKVYIDKVMDKDIINSVKHLEKGPIKVHIISVKKEDSSDDFNYKEKWTFMLEDNLRRRHTLIFDVPKLINNTFLYLGGNKKNVINQLLLKPIVKTAPDTVQICSNYNKIFLTRYGATVSNKLERLKKILAGYKNKNVSISAGNALNVNNKYKTTIEFDDLSKSFIKLDINKNINIYFDIPRFLKDTNYKIKDKYANIKEFLPIGTYKNQPILLNLSNSTLVLEYSETNIDLIDFIVERIGELDPNFYNLFYTAKTGNKFMYTQATIMAKKIPLILLLGYCEGLSTVFKRASIKYELSEKKVVLTGDAKNSKGIIKFSDTYLIYDKYPFSNSLLLNGLTSVQTELYTFNDFNSKDTYVEIYYDLLNSRNIVNAFDNFYTLMIDNITEEILEKLHLPTNFTDVLLYANRLLENNDYISETDMRANRLRMPEIISALVYKQVSKAYERYCNSSANANPQKISVDKNIIIKELLSSNIVEDYSVLNPMLEMERTRAVSYKGPSGLNLEQAYTIEKRSFNPTMTGVLAISSPPTGAVGVTRYLTLDPRIKSTRGFIDIAKDENDLNQANMFMTSELLTPTSPTRDDAPRVAMSSAQSKHVVPVKNASPILMGNGTEKALAHIICDDFAFKAKADGKVIEKSDDLMVLQYKNGKTEIVDLTSTVEKNGGGGFYISNKLNTTLKANDSFKEGDIVALNNKFFKDKDIHGDPSFKPGALEKVAVFTSKNTFEDSTIVSKKLCNDSSTEIVMKKEVILNKNANIEYLVKIGQMINAGDNIAVFEEGYDDPNVNIFLQHIGSELGEQIGQLGKTTKKSKYSGVIHDIKIYYNTPFDELNTSLQKLITNYKKTIENKYKIAKKYNNNNMLLIPSVEKINSPDGKIKGVTVGEGVLIEVYIKFDDVMNVGDKLTYFMALKSIISDTFDEGKEPYTEFQPDNKIDAYLGTRSVLARMIGSITSNLFCNKILINGSMIVKGILEEDEGVYKQVDNRYFKSVIKK